MAGQPSALPDDLDDEVRSLIAPHMAENDDTLKAIGIALAAKRDEAKAARASSGIEAVWKECEEAYIGIDEANRGEFTDNRWSKPMSVDGPVTTGKKPVNPDHKSTAFVRITARYVDAGAAKLSEILLPPDDAAFSFTETPVPELIKAKDDTSQVVEHPGAPPLMRTARPHEAAALTAGPAQANNVVPFQPGSGAPAAVSPPLPGSTATGAAPVSPSAGAPASAPLVPVTVKDLAEENIELARKKAKKAEKRIYGWMVKAQYQGEVRKVLHDAARIGVGVLKGPIPKPTRDMAIVKAAEGIELEIKESIEPSFEWVDPWNIFPDPACGENIHDGDYVFERDYLSERQIRKLKDTPGYIAKQLDRVLAEGPDKINVKADSATSSNPGESARKNRYEVFYYFGALKEEEMNAVEKAASDGKASADNAKPKPQVYAIVTLINDSVVRATINPLDSGSFPYHSMPWQRRSGSWAGIGVGEQVRMPQKTVNAATRAMLNNAGISGGCQIIIDRSAVNPADGSWVITPNKIWNKTGDSPGSDVRAAMQTFVFPNVTKQMMTIINYGLQLAEESTSIPLITQGQSGETTPDTFGAAQLQNNNANQLLRSIGYQFDYYITEPVVRQSYEWLLLDPDVPDDEKGDFQINAHGSVALVERAIQNQAIGQMAQIVLNPAYGFNPKLWGKLYCKSQRIDPAELQYTEEEQKRIDSTPPPAAPAVEAAKIRAGVDTQKIAADKDTAHAKIATESTVDLHKLEVQRELAMLEYANRERTNLATVKAELAKTAMQLNTEERLNAADRATDLHKHHNPQPPMPKPPVQTPGRAGRGRAFEQSP